MKKKPEAQTHYQRVYDTLSSEEKMMMANKNGVPSRLTDAYIQDYEEKQAKIAAYDEAKATFKLIKLSPEEIACIRNGEGIPSWFIDEYLKVPLNPRIKLYRPTDEERAHLQRQEDEYKKRHGIKGELNFDQHNNMDAEQRALEKKQGRWFGSGTFINLIANLKEQLK